MSLDVKKLLLVLTLDDKVGLCSGEDLWNTKAVERLRNRQFLEDSNNKKGTSQFW